VRPERSGPAVGPGSRTCRMSRSHPSASAGPDRPLRAAAVSYEFPEKRRRRPGRPQRMVSRFLPVEINPSDRGAFKNMFCRDARRAGRHTTPVPRWGLRAAPIAAGVNRNRSRRLRADPARRAAGAPGVEAGRSASPAARDQSLQPQGGVVTPTMRGRRERWSAKAVMRMASRCGVDGAHGVLSGMSPFRRRSRR